MNMKLGGAQEDKYIVVQTKTNAADTVLEEVEFSRALFEIYEGGVVSDWVLCFTRLN
jgi:DEAD/DEAH box helicase domain-containing protein